jgi:preprotein translocase subunit SecE
MNFFEFTNYKIHVEIFTCIMSALPWLVDLTLLFRLVAIYPPRTQALSTTIAVFAFPVAVKLARLVLISLFIKEYAYSIHLNIVQDAVVVSAKIPYGRAEWFLQFFDNA